MGELHTPVYAISHAPPRHTQRYGLSSSHLSHTRRSDWVQSRRGVPEPRLSPSSPRDIHGLRDARLFSLGPSTPRSHASVNLEHVGEHSPGTNYPPIDCPLRRSHIRRQALLELGLPVTTSALDSSGAPPLSGRRKCQACQVCRPLRTRPSLPSAPLTVVSENSFGRSR